MCITDCMLTSEGSFELIASVQYAHTSEWTCVDGVSSCVYAAHTHTHMLWQSCLVFKRHAEDYFPAHTVCSCVRFHIICVLALREFLSRCDTNNRLLKYGVHASALSLVLFAACVCAYITLTSDQGDICPPSLMPFHSAPPHSACWGGGRNKQVIQAIAHTC